MHDALRPEVIRLNYDDFCALPDDGRRYEILDGDLYMSPSPAPRHQILVLNLGGILQPHVSKHKLGRIFVAPLDVLLSEHDIVEPDLIFVSNARESIITDKHIKGAPDLLVEVLSPSTSSRDQRDKRNIYARCGVPWYWIVNPDPVSIVELELSGSAYAVTAECAAGSTFCPRLFPGLQIDATRLAE